MTKADITNALKEAWTAALMDEKDILDDIADSYASWVQAIVKAAAPELKGEPAAQEGSQQEQGGGQEQGQGQQGAPANSGLSQGGPAMQAGAEGGGA